MLIKYSKLKSTRVKTYFQAKMQKVYKVSYRGRWLVRVVVIVFHSLVIPVMRQEPSVCWRVLLSKESKVPLNHSNGNLGSPLVQPRSLHLISFKVITREIPMKRDNP